MNGEINPWAVVHLDEFLYFCCPECDLSRETIFQSRELFLCHAFNNHPKSKDCLEIFGIKEEPVDTNNDVNLVEEQDVKNEYIDENIPLKRVKKIEPIENVKCELSEGEEYNNEVPIDNDVNLDDKQCHFCNKTYKYTTSLKLHIKTVHEGQERIKAYKCNKCGTAFSGMYIDFTPFTPGYKIT